MIRRGSFMISDEGGGGLESLDGETKTKLLEKVKEKLVKEVLNKDSEQEEPVEQIEQTEDTSQEDEQQDGGEKKEATRKDRDLMSDTGGSSKVQRDPEIKPPREDCHERYRDRNISKEERKDLNSDTKNDPDLKLSRLVKIAKNLI